MNELERIMLEDQEEIPSWIKAGKKFIYPQKHKRWEKFVVEMGENIFCGCVLDNVIEVMSCLHNGGSLQDANKLLHDAGHSGGSIRLTLTALVRFCKQGPDLYDFIDPNQDTKTKRYLEHVRRKNARFEGELKMGKGKE